MPATTQHPERPRHLRYSYWPVAVLAQWCLLCGAAVLGGGIRERYWEIWPPLGALLWGFGLLGTAWVLRGSRWQWTAMPLCLWASVHMGLVMGTDWGHNGFNLVASIAVAVGLVAIMVADYVQVLKGGQGQGPPGTP